MTIQMLADVLIRGVLVLGCAWLVNTVLLARASAAVRHATWALAFALLLLVPAVTLFGPAWQLRLISLPAPTDVEPVVRLVDTRDAVVPTDTPRAAAGATLPLRESGAPVDARASRVGPLTRAIVAWFVWAAGVAVGLLRLGLGLLWPHVLVRRGVRLFRSDWEAALNEAACSLHLFRPVRAFISDDVPVPVAAGILRPVLLLPRQALTWDEERRRVVLLHELAHVARHDCAIQVIAQVARALHWPNPLAHLAARKLRAEQERACDDLVLTRGVAANRYATHLCDVVQAAGRQAVPAAVPSMGRPLDLEQRVSAILDCSRRRGPMTVRMSLALGATAFAAAVPLGAVRLAPSLPGALQAPPTLASSRAEVPSLWTAGRALPVRPSAVLWPAGDAALSPAQSAPGPQPTTGPGEVRAALDQYCVTCHTSARSFPVANVALDAFQANETIDPALGERVLRKLRAGLHPPKGAPRPDGSVREALIATISGALDHVEQRTVTPVAAVGPVQVAGRLAAMLWDAPPDAELLRAAESGRLAELRVLDDQIRRMLGDDRAAAFVDRFFTPWLHLGNVATVQPDEDVFPAFDAELRDGLLRETGLLIADHLRQDHPVGELLTANYTFVNERVAKHYGIAGVSGPAFQRVAVADDARLGLLGQGSILLVTSYAHRTSPVLRGKYILEILLGTPVPAPPANVPPLEAARTDTEGGRAKLERHRRNPVCASCHASMDAFGFALENFDGVGQWRQFDAGQPIEASATLPDGTDITGPADLRQALLQHESAYVTNIAERLLAYAIGRPLDYPDLPTVRQIVREAAVGANRWSALVSAVARSAPFRAP
ncbi:MAG: DUF1592 domain-containing protein [Acidimicrobiia bacterium]|nr:DUF1592 domain-containing protein [Acidimicrobiia bacterium]